MTPETLKETLTRLYQSASAAGMLTAPYNVNTPKARTIRAQAQSLLTTLDTYLPTLPAPSLPIYLSLYDLLHRLAKGTPSPRH